MAVYRRDKTPKAVLFLYQHFPTGFSLLRVYNKGKYIPEVDRL